jgi:hypothetical protein
VAGSQETPKKVFNLKIQVLFIYIETWQVHKTPEKKSTCSNFSDTLFNFGKVARNVAGYGNSEKSASH